MKQNKYKAILNYFAHNPGVQTIPKEYRGVLKIVKELEKTGFLKVNWKKHTAKYIK